MKSVAQAVQAAGRSPLSALTRVGGFAALWWILTEAAPGAWLIGAPAVLAAVVFSFALGERGVVRRVRPAAMLRLLAFLLHRSVAGGVDVARRALHPRMPLDPALLEIELTLPDEGARVLLCNAMSLLPGTLSATLAGGRLHLHVLDRAMPAADTLRELERRLAAAFGWRLTASVPCSR